MPKATALQEAEKTDINPDDLGEMFSAGAHYGLARSRRHPSTIDYIFGLKGGIEIIDLEKTQSLLEDAEEFMRQRGKEGEQVVFVTSKNEGNDIVRTVAASIEQPFVTGRWIGGTYTNFNNIQGRIRHLGELEDKQESGELDKYTKKEQLLFQREIDRLKDKFGGIRNMNKLPAAMVVVDSKNDAIAVEEAHQAGVPVVSLSNIDCDINLIDYPIVANDARAASIRYFMEKLRDAYANGAGITL
ncbi:MAG: 30S ribosomal protein S2 [Candidatus Paceibacterota bacterium]